MNKTEVISFLLSQNFHAFVMKVFLEITGEKYLDNWHIRLICGELVKMMDGQQNRLIINLPLHSLKSIICSIAFPAWLLGKNPNLKIILACYAESLSGDFSSKIKQVLEADWYKKLFPGTRIKKAQDGGIINTTRRGFVYPTSIEGSVTGIGSDYIIVDDPVKAIDGNGEAIINRCNEWFSSSLVTRLNDKQSGRILVVMQRLNKKDLSGYLIEKEIGFKSLVLPLKAVEAEAWKIYDPMRKQYQLYTRKKGEPLHPIRNTAEQISEISKDMTPESFLAQCQQFQISEPFIDTATFENEMDAMKAINSGKIKIRKIIHLWTVFDNKGKLDLQGLICAEKESGMFYRIGSARYQEVWGKDTTLDDCVSFIERRHTSLRTSFPGCEISCALSGRGNNHRLVDMFKPKLDSDLKIIPPATPKKMTLVWHLDLIVLFLTKKMPPHMDIKGEMHDPYTWYDGKPSK